MSLPAAGMSHRTGRRQRYNCSSYPRSGRRLVAPLPRGSARPLPFCPPIGGYDNRAGQAWRNGGAINAPAHGRWFA